jgi:sortase A
VIRKLGFVLVGLAALTLVWAGVTVWWGDPITSLYTRHEQHALARQLDAMDREWRGRSQLAAATIVGTVSRADRAAFEAAHLQARARTYERTLQEGGPVGRIVIPRIGLRMVVVEGTSEGDLRKGPGHYNATSGEQTTLPGMGGVMGIAGHRTTYSHPFRYINDLRPGDKIYLEMPYGKFAYTVYYHKIVSPDDWSILRKRPYEKLVLSACHPLYSASHRYVIFARLTSSPVHAKHT